MHASPPSADARPAPTLMALACLAARQARAAAWPRNAALLATALCAAFSKEGSVWRALLV